METHKYQKYKDPNPYVFFLIFLKYVPLMKTISKATELFRVFFCSISEGEGAHSPELDLDKGK